MAINEAWLVRELIQGEIERSAVKGRREGTGGTEVSRSGSNAYKKDGVVTKTNSYPTL
jgi:hypothetical protein